MRHDFPFPVPDAALAYKITRATGQQIILPVSTDVYFIESPNDPFVKVGNLDHRFRDLEDVVEVRVHMSYGRDNVLAGEAGHNCRSRLRDQMWQVFKANEGALFDRVVKEAFEDEDKMAEALACYRYLENRKIYFEKSIEVIFNHAPTDAARILEMVDFEKAVESHRTEDTGDQDLCVRAIHRIHTVLGNALIRITNPKGEGHTSPMLLTPSKDAKVSVEDELRGVRVEGLDPKFSDYLVECLRPLKLESI